MESSNRYWYSFRNWFDDLKGHSVVIDFKERKVTILNEQQKAIGIARFSKKIQHHFTVEDLLEYRTISKKETSTSAVMYTLMIKGYGGINWLYEKEFWIIEVDDSFEIKVRDPVPNINVVIIDGKDQSGSN